MIEIHRHTTIKQTRPLWHSVNTNTLHHYSLPLSLQFSIGDMLASCLLLSQRWGKFTKWAIKSKSPERFQCKNLSNLPHPMPSMKRHDMRTNKAVTSQLFAHQWGPDPANATHIFWQLYVGTAER